MRSRSPRRPARPISCRIRIADIEVPKNSAMGPVLGAIGFALAFGLVWHIWWLAIVGVPWLIATLIARSFVRDDHRIIPAAEVERTDRAWLQHGRRGAADPASDRNNIRQPGPRGGVDMSAPQGNARRARSLRHRRDDHEKAGVDVFGFWVFLMSDAVIFALLFATYGAMLPGTAGGPTPAQEYKIRPGLY